MFSQFISFWFQIVGATIVNHLAIILISNHNYSCYLNISIYS